MKLIDAVDYIFGHNEIISIWETEDSHHSILKWKGMAWNLPDELKNATDWKIFGLIPESIYDADAINIRLI